MNEQILPKPIKSTFKLDAYWITTGLFALFMLVSAIGELTFSDEVVNSMTVLDIPSYFLGLLGFLKLLGLVAILVPGYPILKEWAYAGFVFDFIGALYALAVVQPPFISDYIAAPAALMLCITSYVMYRRKLNSPHFE